MKKTIALIMCMLMAFSFCACGKTPAEDPSAGPAEISERSAPQSAEEISAEGSSAEEISEETSVPECEKKAEIDSYFHGEVESGLPRSNVLLNKSYTLEGRVSSSYKGTEKTLSDGVLPQSFNRYSWIGMENSNAEIVFDLGGVTEKIGASRAGCLSQNDYAIYLPPTVMVYCSDDGKDYYRVCRMYAPSGLDRAMVYHYDLALQEYVSARYIKFVLSNAKGFTFIGELEAYVYGVERDDSLDLGDIYPAYTVPHAELSYIENGSGEEKNLALGAEVHAVAFSTVEKKNINETGNVQNTSLLCDGEKGRAASWDADYTFRVTRGDGREFIFDLGNTVSVERFTAQAVYKPSWGVYPPDDIYVCVSADGEEWQSVAVMSVPDGDLDGNDKLIAFASSANAAYRARFVKFVFLFATHSAFTEFEIFGTEKVPETAIMPDNSKSIARAPCAYPAASSLGGAQNVLCSYLCATSSHCGVYDTMLTYRDYLDIIGYYEDGELKDVIFDAMVVTPHGNFAPDGKKETLEGWQPFFDTLFTKDRGLEAISQAAAEIGKAKGDGGYKEKIFLSVIRPAAKIDGKINSFGDIDGDGVNESFGTLENRKKVIRWEVDMQLERLAETDAPNLELLGFYWLSEALYYDEPDEIEIVRYAIDYVHSKGYLMFWIPYYNASGWSTWKELGFDFACLQPNYSFMSVEDPDRLYTAALKAKLFGMAVEIELDSPTADVNIRRYKEYLASGLEYGYMYSPKVYYLGGVPSDLTSARDSSNEYVSSIYADTYLYSRCGMTEDYDPYHVVPLVAPEAMSLEGSRGKRINGQATVDTADDYTLVVTVQPKYGTIELMANGKFVYIPEKGFYGDDWFRIAARYINGVSADARVDVHVQYTPEN